MDKNAIEFQGKTYFRDSKGIWRDKNGMAVSNLQSTLNKLYFESISIETMTADEILQEADKLKESGSNGYAAKLYEKVIDFVTSNQRFGLFSKLSSCYRAMGQPKKTIELFERAVEQYGNGSISDAFMTSVAAAYCDLEEYVKAKEAANRAFAISGGKASGELKGVYGRIRKQTTGSGRYDGPED